MNGYLALLGWDLHLISSQWQQEKYDVLLETNHYCVPLHDVPELPDNFSDIFHEMRELEHTSLLFIPNGR